MLEYFYVRNYKCLADVGIPLTPIHVIIGQNDSGKTSLLEAMFALVQSANFPLAKAFSGDWQGWELINEQANHFSLEFEAEFNVEDGSVPMTPHYRLEVGFDDTGRVCHAGSEKWNGELLNRTISYMDDCSTLVAERLRRPQTPGSHSLNAIAKSLGRANLYRFDPKQMAIPAAIDPSRRFRMDSDGFGLATILDDILNNEPGEFIELSRDFCSFFPQFKNVRIETVQAVSRQFQENGRHSTSEANGKGIVFETTGGRKIRAQQASDGAILFLGLLALIHSPEAPTLLLIEEPEKGIYPKRLDEVIGLIRRLREVPSGRPAPQIIMTTHSPYLLTSFSPEEVTLMVRRDGGKGAVEARPLRDAPHIQERLGNGEFYLGELWYNLSEDELFTDA